jgi:signal recognition particle GTPase
MKQLNVLANQIQLLFFAISPIDTSLAIAKDTTNHAKNKFINNIIEEIANHLHIDQEMIVEIKHQ